MAQTFKSFGEFGRAFRKDMRKVERGIDGAANRAAQRVAWQIRRDMPVAHGELRDSVHVEGSRVIVDAPHAAAVETGSRPHWAPLEPLIEWVQLRGFQSLLSSKSRMRLPGNTTQEHASRVGAAFAAVRRGGAVGVQTPFTPIGAAYAIAKGIQLRIALAGTRPHWYVRKHLPAARTFLSIEVNRVLQSGG